MQVQRVGFGATQPLSHFQLGRIHGLPLEPWAGVPATTPPTPTNGSMWCSHHRPTFRQWHRPYVRLYEMALQAAANSSTVLDHFKSTGPTELPQYIAAAKALRLPYIEWDAVGADRVLMNFCLAPTVDVIDATPTDPGRTRCECD